ncbi:MAG: N2,N2-dimethylguanosine tRNA methyltransferase [Desulfurococcaceae archaeon]
MIEEGLAKALVPNPELYKRVDGRVEPAWMPVFYNPEARLQRDITVAVLRTFFVDGGFEFVDLLAGTGIRSVRMALEAGGTGIANDVDPRAYRLIARNVELNGLGPAIIPMNHDAVELSRLLLFSGFVPDYVDVDPYGSPLPFLEAAMSSLGRRALIGITATDVASLACLAAGGALRKYALLACGRSDFEREVGLRSLLATIAIRAASLDRAARPLISFGHRHYYRAFVLLERGAESAAEGLRRCVGYAWFCGTTLERGFVESSDVFEEGAPRCADGTRSELIGPIWICEMADAAFVKSVLEDAASLPFIARGALKLLGVLARETGINAPYYRLDKLCSRLGINMPRLEELLERLRSMGYSSARTHFDGRGFRTDAPHDEVVKALRGL